MRACLRVPKGKKTTMGKHNVDGDDGDDGDNGGDGGDDHSCIVKYRDDVPNAPRPITRTAPTTTKRNNCLTHYFAPALLTESVEPGAILT